MLRRQPIVSDAIRRKKKKLYLQQKEEEASEL